MKTICVYCGSSDRVAPVYLEAAYQMGKAIARRGLELWYGAGSTGLMGSVANGVLQSGGQVVGVIPELFNTPQLAHMGLTRLEVVESMHARKQRLALAADGFAALPGGFGTFEEFFEILTWAQIGLHSKPIALLNTAEYFQPLLEMIENARKQGFIYNEHQSLFSSADEPEELLDILQGYEPPAGLERWLTRENEHLD
jgi:uncharacterized protein (TIGR00730 family)